MKNDERKGLQTLDEVLDSMTPLTPELEEELERELMMSGTETIINGCRFVCTCSMCPEQYDVFFNDQYVAYVRKRHGHLAAHPVIDHEIQWDEEFYSEDSGDPYDGVIENREDTLKNIAREIKKHILLPK